MEEFLPRKEHEEFAKRMEEEHRRQNHRIANVEDVLRQNNKLLISVERLALSVENMQKEQQEMGEHLEALEARDGENWRETVGYVISALIGAAIAALVKQIGF